MSNPHEYAPLTLLADELSLPDPARGATTYAVGALRVGDLLAEPPRRSGEWVAGVVRRLIAASTGPVACGVRRADYRERLESAGWFCAAEGADVEAARHASWPALPVCRRLGIGAGNPRPTLVLVGESVNRAGQIPFASRAGTWLFLALRLLGYDELTCYVTNALSLRKRRRTKQLAALAKAFAVAEPTWIGLGKCAQEVLAAGKIPHVAVGHPSWHQRYKHAEDVLGYANRMRDAGLEFGPWHSGADSIQRNVPGRGVVSLPELPPPYDIRSVAFARGKSTAAAKHGRQGGKGRQVDVAKREAARRMYVTGEAQTVRAAAEAVDANVDETVSVARSENWKAERAEHAKELTERVKQTHLDNTAERVAEHLTRSLKLSWGALTVGLKDLDRRLRLSPEDTGSLQPSPQQIESLSRVALTLRAASAGQHDPELDALVSEPLKELALRCIDQMEKGLGGA